MSFPYKRVLLVGATAGIGKAMVDRLVKAGVKVIAVGRRKERLDELVKHHGSDKVSGVEFDMSEAGKVPQFAADIIKQYPDLDCVFLNAGVQRRYNFAQPETVDLAGFHNEMNVNYTSFVNIAFAFLPFLLQKQTPTGLVFTGSHLGIIPAAPFISYSASKAALNSFAMSLREQLRHTPVQVVEISPPIVQTELHDAEGPGGRRMGMPADEFAELAYQGLVNGDAHLVIGTVGLGDSPAARSFPETVKQRDATFEQLAEVIRKFM